MSHNATNDTNSINGIYWFCKKNPGCIIFLWISSIAGQGIIMKGTLILKKKMDFLLCWSTKEKHNFYLIKRPAKKICKIWPAGTRHLTIKLVVPDSNTTNSIGWQVHILDHHIKLACWAPRIHCTHPHLHTGVELLPKVCRLGLTSSNDEILLEPLDLVLHTQPSDSENWKYDRWHQTSSNHKLFYGGEGYKYQVPWYAHHRSPYVAQQCQLLSPQNKVVVSLYCFTRLRINLLFIVFTKGLTVHFNPVHAAILSKQSLTCLVFVRVFNLQAHILLTRRPLE